ncbi:MAG: serine esterase [Verrucomicrobia bacterium]|nr:serine esterase [Verrucomicrobiota bacterium]MDE3099789.1 serine esterase [Verrucomicrobiota bacterium]
MPLNAEFLPAAEKASRRLLIMLHGLGDSSEGYRWLPDGLDLPWLNYLLVNGPDPYYGGFSWFDYPDNMTPGILRSRQLLFSLLDEWQAKGFPASEITLGGFSQGSLLTADVGLRHPRRLAGLLCISGWIFEMKTLLQELSPAARQQRMLVSHGKFDPLIPCDKVREQARELQAAGLNVQWREFPKDHSIYGSEEIGVIRKFIAEGYGCESGPQ